MRKIFFDENHQKELMQKGYTIAQLLSDEEIAYLLKELENLHPDDNFSPNNASLNFTYHCTFLDSNIEYKKKADDLIRGVFSSHIQRLLVDYEIRTCNLFVKPPGVGEIEAHQHWPPIQDLNDTTLTIWCPLVDTNVTNGTLHVVEGSHKIVPEIPYPAYRAFFKDFEEALFKKYLKPISLKAGECIIFDDNLIHWSPVNQSSSPRYAIQVLCLPKNTKPVFFYLNQSKPESKFEIFEADSEFFITHSIPDLINGNIHSKSLRCFVENKNRPITEEEFVDLLERGDEIRQKIYYP